MSGASLMAALLNPDLAGHLAVALHRHRGALAENGRARPPGLADLQALAEEVARGGHGQPGAAPRRMPEDHGLHDREWLSTKEVAMTTGLSETTVRRHIRNEELASSKPGGRRVVARCDLDDFMNRRRSGSGGGRTSRGAHERPAADHHAGSGTRRPARSDPDPQEGLGRDRPTPKARRLRGRLAVGGTAPVVRPSPCGTSEGCLRRVSFQRRAFANALRRSRGRGRAGRLRR